MTTRALLSILAIATALTLTERAEAQIVNTQPLVAGVSDDGFDGELRASVDWRTGNIELFRAIGSFLVRYREGPHTFIWSNRGDWGTQGGNVFIASLFTHFRYQARFSELITWEVYGQASTSRFQRLTLRILGGTGPRWNVLSGDKGHLHIGTAYMAEQEQLRVGDFPDSGRKTLSHRLSVYFSGRLVLSPILTLVHTTFVQPRLDAFFSNARVFSDTNLSAKLTDELALTIGALIAYSSHPAVGVAKLDTTFTFGLAWGF